MNPQAWTAIFATAALIAALALLCFGPPAWDAIRANQYRRESKRLGAAEATLEPGSHATPHQLGSPFARLRARNARILDERERQANR